MNREDVTRWAREAGIEVQPPALLLPFLERFAALVASAEREACANVCDGLVDYKELKAARKRISDARHSGDDGDELRAMRHESTVMTFNAGINGCAKAIRARGTP